MKRKAPLTLVVKLPKRRATVETEGKIPGGLPAELWVMHIVPVLIENKGGVLDCLALRLTSRWLNRNIRARRPFFPKQFYDCVLEYARVPQREHLHVLRLLAWPCPMQSDSTALLLYQHVDDLGRLFVWHGEWEILNGLCTAVQFFNWTWLRERAVPGDMVAVENFCDIARVLKNSCSWALSDMVTGIIDTEPDTVLEYLLKMWEEFGMYGPVSHPHGGLSANHRDRLLKLGLTGIKNKHKNNYRKFSDMVWTCYYNHHPECHVIPEMIASMLSLGQVNLVAETLDCAECKLSQHDTVWECLRHVYPDWSDDRILGLGEKNPNSAFWLQRAHRVHVNKVGEDPS